MQNTKKHMISSLLAGAGVIFAVSPSNATDMPSRTTVKMTVTAASLAYGRNAPHINPEDVVVERGKRRLPVTGFVPAQGTHAGLDLFVLIDEASTPSLSIQLDDLRKFIRAQPATTAVADRYVAKGTLQPAQRPNPENTEEADASTPPAAISGA